MHRRFFGVTAVILLVSICWSLQRSQPVPDSQDSVYDQRHLLLEGQLDQVIRRTQRGFYVWLNQVIVREHSQWRSLEGRVRLEIPDGPHIRLLQRGFRIRARASLMPVLNLVNPGTPNWSKSFLRQGILATAKVDSAASVFVVSGGAGQSFLESVRYRFREWTDVHLSSEHAALVEALTLGDRRVVASREAEHWRNAGLSHLLAISGLHVAMACWFVYRMCFFLLASVLPLSTRLDVGRVAALLAIGAAWAYVAVAGAPISATRAGWMITGFWSARVLGRDVNGTTALCHAAIFMCVGDPGCVLDPGCQLSFMAVSALIFGMPGVNRSATWIREHMPYAIVAYPLAFCWQSLAATLLCTLGTLPVVIWTFQAVPLDGLLANIVAIPWAAWGLILPSMLVLSCVALMISPPPILESWLSMGAETANLIAASFADYLPTVEFPGINLWQWLALSISALACILVFHVKRQRFALFCLAFLGLISVATARQLPSSAPGRLVITFLAVGHGDAAVVQMPNGFTLLVDTGGDPTGRFDVGRRIVVPALQSLGVRKLDAILITHPHPDHVGGLSAVVNALDVGELWVNGCTLNAPGMRSFSGLKRRNLALGPPSYRLGDIEIQVLHPRAHALGCYSTLSANDNSLAVRLEYGSFSVLFSGDLERAAEEIVLGGGRKLTSTVLKTAHHGSRTSSTPAFLNAVQPAVAVIQSADHEPFPFPHPEIEARLNALGIRLLVTGRHGAIQVQSDGKRWELSRWK